MQSRGSRRLTISLLPFYIFIIYSSSVAPYLPCSSSTLFSPATTQTRVVRRSPSPQDLTFTPSLSYGHMMSLIGLSNTFLLSLHPVQYFILACHRTEAHAFWRSSFTFRIIIPLFFLYVFLLLLSLSYVLLFLPIPAARLALHSPPPQNGAMQSKDPRPLTINLPLLYTYYKLSSLCSFLSPLLVQSFILACHNTGSCSQRSPMTQDLALAFSLSYGPVTSLLSIFLVQHSILARHNTDVHTVMQSGGPRRLKDLSYQYPSSVDPYKTVQSGSPCCQTVSAAAVTRDRRAYGALV